MAVLHFALDLEVFGEVQEEMEGDKEHFFLLLNNLRQLLLILPELSLSLLILLHVLDIFQIFIFLFEFFDPNNVSFDFVVDDLNGSITNLVRQQKFMELSKVRVSLENIQQIQSQFYRLFIVVTESPTHSAEESLVFEHDLHILVAQAQEEDALSSLCLEGDVLLVEHLDVVV